MSVFLFHFSLPSPFYLLSKSEELGLDAVTRCSIGLTTGRKNMSKHPEVITWEGFLPRVLDNMSSKIPSISDCLSHREPQFSSIHVKYLNSQATSCSITYIQGMLSKFLSLE